MKEKLKFFFTLVPVILIGFLNGCKSDSNDKKLAMQEMGIYESDELSLQHGTELFNQHCASCHSFMGNEIGPSLNGVTSEVDKDWLISFIKDPKTLIIEGDARAVALFEKYNQYMPAFPNFNDAELEDLLAFIHRFSEAEKNNKKSRSGAILNPIVEKIPTSNLALVIQEWLTIPPSSEEDPLARINKLSGFMTAKGERMFIADLRGKLYEIVDDTVQVYLDLNEQEENFVDNPGWGTGLGSFDFHPEFETNGLFYTTHTEPSKSRVADFAIHDTIPTINQWVLTEWKTDKAAAQKFSGEKRELLRVDMLRGAHGFQEVTFNPLAKKGDAEYGLLYLCVGDGAAALRGHPYLCGDPGKIWGSIVRIDPTGRNSKNGNYGIPKDNPFVNQKDKLDEIWSYGFRNPHRLTWNPNSPHQMLVSNIGQHSVEEVDWVQEGRNYGWPNREGTFLFDVEANTEVVYPLPENDSLYTYPVIQYDHDEGNAVSGGFVYSGDKIPLLQNKYIFGDIPRGTLFYSETSEIVEGQQANIFKLGLEFEGKKTDLEAITQSNRVNLRFGQDRSGELYIFTKSNGKVYKVVDCKVEKPSTS